MHKDRPERHTGRLMALWGGVMLFVHATSPPRASLKVKEWTRRRSRRQPSRRVPDTAEKSGRRGGRRFESARRTRQKRSKFLAVESVINLSGLSLPSVDLMITGGKFQA